MKKNILITGVILAAVMTGLSSCSRDTKLISPVTIPTGNAMIHFVDASPNFRKIFNLADSFNVFVNGVKVTSYTPGTSFLMTFNSSYPTVTTLYGYVSVPAGTDAIKLTVAGVVNPDSIPIQTFTKTLAANQLYTFMITDSIQSGRDSSKMFMLDSYQQPTTGYYNMRFIHAVWNDTAGKAVDIWSTRDNRYIYTNIKPGTITSFSQYAFNALYNDTFFVRRTGLPSLTLDTLNSVSFSNQRTYTLYYKGDANSNTSFTANPKRRHLATYVHQ